MPAKGMKNLPIEESVHQDINIESAKARKPMYVLAREAWEAHQRGKGTGTNYASESGVPPQETSPSQGTALGVVPERGDMLVSLLERHPHGKQLQRVIYVLDSGVEDAIAALLSNILSFYIRARRERGETDEASYHALLEEVRTGSFATGGPAHRTRAKGRRGKSA